MDHGPGHLRMARLAHAPVGLSRPGPPVALSDFGEREIVMGQIALRVEATVEAHLGTLASGNRLELRDTAKADDLGPEPVRDLEVSNVEDHVIDAAWRQRLTRSHGRSVVGHGALHARASPGVSPDSTSIVRHGAAA